MTFRFRGRIKIVVTIMSVEERNGELWVNMGRSDEFLQFSSDDEFLTMVTTRFERLQ